VYVLTDKKKPHIKKPLNAFMLYMKEMRAKVVAECTLKESAAINQILGRRVSIPYAQVFLAFSSTTIVLHQGRITPVTIRRPFIERIRFGTSSILGIVGDHLEETARDVRCLFEPMTQL